MKKLLQRRQGFTLIELLIVIVIIGILSVGFAPTLLNAPKKARDGVRKGQIASIQQAVEAYALDKASYPATGCITSDTDVGKALAPFFQGSVLPKDQSVQAFDADPKPTAACASGFYFYNPGSCYAIMTKLEVGPGNTDKLTPDCAASLNTGTDQKLTPYFAVTQKY